jgi:crotonobetainyl-CoA:carnitine CoA-transferase CaiB-like acyl-CoA transferase
MSDTVNQNTASNRDGTLPLSGLLVLDLTLARAGPTATRHLADWGADVIRVQPPDDGSEEVIGRRDGADYQNLHRNKRVITLDLKQPEGHEAFLRLVKRADVVIENMRAPVKRRLKIAYEDLEPINPRLIYGSISGFGQTGPYANRAGVDQIAQGMSGLMSVTGEPGRGPMRVGIAVADMTAGNLLALAVMMALFERQKTGRGRWVHTSLLESLVFMMDFQAARYLMNNVVPQQVGNDHPTVVPTGVFATSDGYIGIGASSTGQWQRLCELLRKPDWMTDPAWATQRDRAKDRVNVHAAIAAEIKQNPTAHWVEAFEAVELPCGPVYSVDQVFADPQVQHLGIAAPLVHPKLGLTHLVASPLNIEGIAKKIRTAAPVSGVHSEEILSELGYDGAEIESLRARKITQ